jgi:hypothetical protein
MKEKKILFLSNPQKKNLKKINIFKESQTLGNTRILSWCSVNTRKGEEARQTSGKEKKNKFF